MNRGYSIKQLQCAVRIATVLIATVFIFSACSPTLRDTLEVPVVNAPAPGKNVEKVSNAYLYIDEFSDARANKALASMDEKEIQPAGDVVPAVVKALKEALINRGFEISESAPVMVSGEVRQWFAEISGSMPTRVNVEAAIFIEVLDPANKRIYSGVYQGKSWKESSSMKEEDIRKTLGEGMEEAIKRVTADERLMGLISSF